MKPPINFKNINDKLQFYQVLICLIINSFGPITFYLPGKFDKVSFGIGIFILLVTAASAKFTMDLMLIISREYKIDKYSDLVKLIMGYKMAFILDGVIILNGFFCYVQSFIQSDLI